MLNSVQKSIVLSSLTVVALVATQTAFAADDGLVGGLFSGIGDVLGEAFNVTMELARRLGGG